MNITICSREEMEAQLAAGIPENTAVISFSDPIDSRTPKDYAPLDFTGKHDRVFPVALYDLDMDCLPQVGLTYDTFFPEVSELAEFIYQAQKDGLDFICQCEYGQSRSAACAAAILEHFYKNGISIFADYRYYPNQMVYHKVFDALQAEKERRTA